MSLKINGSDIPYNVSPVPFTSQHGHKGIRFEGDEIPTTDKGFKLYDDDGNEVADYSAFTFEYRQNEYTDAEDVIVYPVGSDAPLAPSALSRLNSKVNRLSSQVADITPFTETKTAYYGETEKTFYGVPDGNTSVFFDKYSGGYSVSRTEDRLIISFDETIIEATNVTVMVQ